MAPRARRIAGASPLAGLARRSLPARPASARPGPAGEPDRRPGHLRPRDRAAHRHRQRRGALPGPGAAGAADHLRRGGRRDPRRGTAGADRPGRRRAARRRRGADPRPDRRPDLERAAADRRPAAARRRRGPPHAAGATPRSTARSRAPARSAPRTRRRPGRSAPRASPRTTVARRIYFENARFELFGLPIGYLPRLSIPEPGVERASGVLVPSFLSLGHLRLRLQAALLPRARPLGRHDGHALRHHRAAACCSRASTAAASTDGGFDICGRPRPRRRARATTSRRAARSRAIGRFGLRDGFVADFDLERGQRRQLPRRSSTIPTPTS